MENKTDGELKKLVSSAMSKLKVPENTIISKNKEYKKMKENIVVQSSTNSFLVLPQRTEAFPKAGVIRFGTNPDGYLLINSVEVKTDQTISDDFDIDDSDNKSKVIVSKYFPIEKYCTTLAKFDNDLNNFLNKEQFYIDKNIDYKRNYLLFGDTGTGKTQKIYQTCKELIDNRGAYVVELKKYDDIETVLSYDNVISELFRDKFLVFWVEELFNLTVGNPEKLSTILNILDNKHFSNKVIWLITTNHPEHLPTNIVDRPSRIDKLIKVDSEHYTDDMIENWYEFLMGEKLDLTGLSNDDIKLIKKLSIAYLKELFMFSHLHDFSLKESIDEIRERQELIKKSFTNKKAMGFGFTKD